MCCFYFQPLGCVPVGDGQMDRWMGGQDRLVGRLLPMLISQLPYPKGVIWVTSLVCAHLGQGEEEADDTEFKLG